MKGGIILPPKPKFTREEIISVALEIVSQKGISALTAREVGEKLGSSARPIFTIFKNMEELNEEVRKAAMEKYNGYIEEAMDYTPAFKQVGIQMIKFATIEPKLYQLIFMTDNNQISCFEDIFDYMGEMANVCVDVISSDYHLSKEDAKALFTHMWMYAFGMSSLCASGICVFSEEEIIKMLGVEFMALIMLIKSGKLNDITPNPMPKSEKGQLRFDEKELWVEDKE